MRAISRDEIEQGWYAICELDEEQTQTLVQRFMQEQPALGIYISVGFESLEEHPDSPLIEVILACWQAMFQSTSVTLKQVTPEEIESAEEKNTQALQQLEESSEIEWQAAVVSLLGDYNQRELLGFGIEMLMSGNEESPELAPESIGLELIWLKTTLDCLDKAG
ncbi:MAG: hypothetical protein ACREIC_09725 [Limisphaerales bacterium]